MIQIILTWGGDWDLIQSPYHAKSKVNEMVDNTYLVLLNEPDDFDALEQEMENQPDGEDEFDVFKVGAYNMDGTHYIYGKPNRKHSINKYRGKLRGSPTETEALNTQVNRIFKKGGSPDRILTDPI